MKSNRTTIVLLVLFFGGLLVHVGARRSGRPHAMGRAAAAGPGPARPDRHARGQEIRRRGDRPGRRAPGLRAPRRGPGRWQMVEPMDVAAEPTRLETLVRNLKDLRRSPDAGTSPVRRTRSGWRPRRRPSGSYGAKDGATGVRSSRSPRSRSARPSRGQRYVRPAGAAGRRGRGRPAARRARPARGRLARAGRDGRADVPGRAVKITRRSEPGAKPQVIRAERSRDGRWKLTAPLEVARQRPQDREPARGARIAPGGRYPQGFRGRRRQGLRARSAWPSPGSPSS